MIKKKGVIVSGYFNPIHKGHIDYFKKATNIKSTTSFNNQYFLNLAKVYKLKKDYTESLNIINTILEDSKIKYNIKNEAQELQGELNFLINKY